MYKLRIKLLMTAAVISSLLLTVRSFAASQIRIVRLSDVHGDVQTSLRTWIAQEQTIQDQVTLETTKPGVYRVTGNIQ